jgi:hypothetical protein
VDGFGHEMSGNRRLRGVGVVAILLAVVAFVASGCASDKQPSKTVASAAVGSKSSASASVDKGNPVAYAQCMRTNGVPEFPDPDTGGAIKLPGGGKAGNLDPDSPAFKSAHEKCKQYMGTGQTGAQSGQDPWSLDNKLQYAKCMRQNGLASFPDPDKNGQFPRTDKGSDLSPDSPQFKQADKACAKYKPQGGNGGGGQGGAGS